jgi:transcriptional regulator with XRE-family HTH domain
MDNFFPDQLRSLRVFKGLNQEQLAEALGFKSKQRISDYENGKTEPGLDDLIRMANFFNVDLNTLITKSEKSGQNQEKSFFQSNSKEGQEAINELKNKIKELEEQINNLKKDNSILVSDFRRVSNKNQELNDELLELYKQQAEKNKGASDKSASQ